MDIILEDNNNEEPKYIVSYDPVKDDGDGSMNVSTFKVEDGVAENINPHNFNVEKILDTLRKSYEEELRFRLPFKEIEIDKMPDSVEKSIYDQLPAPKLLDELVEYANKEYILNSIRTVQKKTKEDLEEEYRLIVTQGPSFMDYGKRIGNSNIYPFELPIPWHTRYFDAMLHQYYRDLGDGWYILLTINKESGIVAAFKIFDKEFDINSDADTKGDILHLYTGNPKDMHEVEEVIKYNTSKNMGFVWADSAPAVLKHPKTQEMGIIPIEHPAPSILDFIEYGKTLEYEALKALRIPINPSLHNDILGHLADHKTNVSIQDSDWLVSSLLMQSGFKGFDQRRRKLAKRRCKLSQYSISCKEHSFYKRYKLV